MVGRYTSKKKCGDTSDCTQDKGKPMKIPAEESTDLFPMATKTVGMELYLARISMQRKLPSCDTCMCLSRVFPWQQQCVANFSSLYGSWRNSTKRSLADPCRGRGFHKTVYGEKPAGPYSLGKRKHKGNKWFLSPLFTLCLTLNTGSCDFWCRWRSDQSKH